MVLTCVAVSIVLSSNGATNRLGKWARNERTTSVLVA